jgi:thiol-disulfide isomerase/thioredoxin
MECLVKKNNKNNENKNKNNENKKNISLYRNLFNLENGVHELVLKDFQIKDSKIIIKNKVFRKNKSFVLFYAPWCSHCKNFKKEYENLALDYIQITSFGSVNIENVKDGNDKLRIAANIEGIPTLKIVNHDGYLEDFHSAVNYDDLLYFINMNL